MEMKDIIAKLEQQREAIERALTALRGIEAPREGRQTPASAPEHVATAPAATAPAAKTGKRGRKGRLTPEGRRRLAEAMKRRWAIKRTAAQAQAKKSARRQ